MFPSRNPYWTGVEPTDRQLWAIGMVAVQWSMLEGMMEIFTSSLIAGDEPAAELKRTPTFKERHRQWRALVEQKAQEPWRARLLALIDQAGQLQQERDRIIHGQWGRDDHQASTPDKLDVFKWSGPKRPFEWTLTYGAIKAVALKIDRLNAALANLVIDAGGGTPNVLLSDALKRICQ